MDPYKKMKMRSTRFFIVWAIFKILPILGLLGIFCLNAKVPASSSKSPIKCFERRNSRVISLVGDVLSESNNTYQEVECSKGLEFLDNIVFQTLLWLTLMILLKVFEVLYLELYDPYFLFLVKRNKKFFQARDTSSNEKFKAANSTPSKRQTKPKPYLKIRNVMNLHEDVHGIKIYSEDVHNGTIPYLLDDQLCDYPTSPEADVPPEQGLVGIV